MEKKAITITDSNWWPEYSAVSYLVWSPTIKVRRGGLPDCYAVMGINKHGDSFVSAFRTAGDAVDFAAWYFADHS